MISHSLCHKKVARELMTLENLSDIASIVSAIIGFVGLFGLGALVYKFTSSAN